ncbi:ADP-ribosylation [Artomyces pyxidatus]|uniref:ADP-ribosylation n=1 Tax=Artomyces pyxidatus TaxID=48021 RepID=A0ACB8SI78_9AGAM|nr:ADP-ribosylation [Artomyces pyxidatus]
MNAVFVDADGVPTSYCSNRHRLTAVASRLAEGCLLCGRYPKATINSKQSDFCSKKCSLAAIGNAPIILPLPQHHRLHVEVVKQFTEKWEHTSAAPSVLKIWKIYGNKAANDTFSRYQLAVERRTGIDQGNTKRRWHGTTRACRLGDDDQSYSLCSLATCSLCSIIRSSFSLAKVGQHTNFGRFGAGLYTSATSSKANDYVSEQGQSPFRSMLLNNVVLGKTVKLTTSDTSLTQPPRGYDSVIGEPGGDLNYDESIVYTNDAIRPSYLVIYHNPSSSNSSTVLAPRPARRQIM